MQGSGFEPMGAFDYGTEPYHLLSPAIAYQEHVNALMVGKVGCD